MKFSARTGARRLALGLVGALLLTGCQSYQATEAADVTRSSMGDGFGQGYDRGMRHSAPYARSGERAARPVATEAPAQPEARPEPRTESRPAPRATGSTVCRPPERAGHAISGLAFPTGDVRSSAIVVHQVMPNEVSMGQDFEYEYHLCNLTDATLQNVVLTVENAANMRIISADPAASSTGAQTMWMLGDMDPRESQVIRVVARADSVGTASNCITVSYNNVLCARTRVVQPALALTKTATPQALLCEDIQYVFEVRNTGSGTARNVHLRDTFPNGVTAGGQSSVDIPLGDIAAGDTKRVTITARAGRTGTFDNEASAVADGGLTANSGRASTVVTAPALEIAADCTDRSFIGRNFTHTYAIRNTGNGACANTTVAVRLPSGAQFVRASSEGVQQGNTVVFNLGEVPAGAQRNVSVTLAAATEGDYASSATVSCACAESVSSNCSTAVRGIPALLLEVIDVEDPDEVGTNEEYIITVTNQGSAPATGIRIVATIPAEMEYVSSTGASAGTVSGRTVTFAPFGPLAPRAQATWQITVRCIAEGDVRFAVEMNADQLTRPVNETESTNLYR